MSNKIYPIDLLTPKDKEDLYQYIDRGLPLSANREVVDSMLEQWSRNKGTIFRALGNQLRVEIELNDVDQYMYERQKRITRLGINYVIYGLDHLRDFQQHYDKRAESSIFCIRFLVFVANKCLDDYLLTWDEVQQLVALQSKKALYTGYTVTDINLEQYGLKIPKGTKIMRAFQKVLKKMQAPEELISAFEDFRNQISNITTALSSTVNSTLVLSIHPIDIMSLSDNNCDWHSCFAWLGGGEYRNSCLEMLTSNLTLVAYLKSKKDFIVGPNSDYTIVLPNKSYRQLFYLHKDILLAGRGYPYQDTRTTIKILDRINELVYNNLKWKYQFRNQEYLEMKNLEEDGSSMFWTEQNDNKHQIFFYTKGQVYNDMALNHDSVGYWCNRNKVKKNLYLNISGPSYCLHCGQQLQTEDHPDNGICNECYDQYYCEDCDYILADGDHFTYTSYYPVENGLTVCDDCIEERYLFDIENGYWISKNSIIWNYRYAHDLSWQEAEELDVEIMINPERYITVEKWKEEVQCRVA